MKWRHSVTFKLFAVTFAVIMLLLGGVLAVLAGTFSSFYERRQAHDIAYDLNRIRDRYVQEAEPGIDGFDRIPDYFFDFEKEYYALTSLLTIEGNKFRVVVGGGFENGLEQGAADSAALPFPLPVPDKFALFMSKPASVEQLDKLRWAAMEWRNDQEAVNDVLLEGKTLVFRTKGVGEDERGANQLIAVTRISGDGAGNGKVLFAVSSLQPVTSAASVIRDFSYYVFCIGLVFALILAFLYAGIVTKPLRNLNESARKLADLDFSGRTRLNRRDEIGELGRSFDSLADNLQRTLAELHEANDKLKEDIERERRLERMRRRFVAGVSHELKTPISLIGGYAEGLRDNVANGAKRERYAEIILDETRRMSAIVADMLDLSYLESGQYALQWETFDLWPLLTESAERAEIMGKDKNIRIVVVRPESGEGTPPVRGDRMRIGQVLTNLLSNAVRHSSPGGSVILSVRAADAEAEISVYNEGDPIPEDELSRIWGHFYRTDQSRSRESGGTGIGLAVVRQIVRLHGGRYGAFNAGEGVVFYFTVKLG
ncbi:sensor histidine kinase [Paenibacillus thailandensis]|uniref:histidine kinase n=1 Tax=Paenibacillus thailandensis TaxID=393250 RepID=A0ABW5R0N1_9BACL